jgi:hypothetical protein
MSHNELDQYFQLVHALTYHHKYSLTEIEDMVPWELNVHLTLIQATMQKAEQEAQQLAQSM